MPLNEGGGFEPPASVHIYRFAKPISASKTVLGSGGSREAGEVWIL